MGLFTASVVFLMLLVMVLVVIVVKEDIGMLMGIMAIDTLRKVMVNTVMLWCITAVNDQKSNNL